MSKTEMLSEKTKPETKEIYAVYRQSVNRYFEEVEKNMTQCMEAMSHLQQEFVLTCRNVLDNTMAFQQEMMTKSGLGPNLPQSYLKSINDATDEFVKTSSLQNKAVITAIDATRQNIKTFHDNLKAFTSMDTSIIQSWFSGWKSPRNS
ncbi:MAG TPA: hypothetical protein VFA69_00330 [Candidatus Nitrosotalea sp.]|nr:hypothetical protein [Candidatus Nitrosotalea sp.]